MRLLFWELFAGLGLFGLIAGVVLLSFGLVFISALILVASMVHFGREA